MTSPLWDLPLGITNQQELLLKAALLPPETALAEWNQWKDAVQFGEDYVPSPDGLTGIFETLDYDSRRLLPLVYRNLQHSGDPLITSLKGNYRFHLLKGKYLIQNVTRIVDALQNKGFDVMLLKGVPLAVLYYQNMGLCPLEDIDILIPPAQAEKAAEFLRDAFGLKVNSHENELRNFGLFGAPQFTEGKYAGLDMHTCIYNLNEEPHQPMWQDRMPIVFGDISTFTLSPTHQLYRNFTQGNNQLLLNHAIRWVPDSLFIMGKSAHEIKWTEFFELASKQKMTLPVCTMLRYLKQHFGLEYPAEVLERIDVKNSSRMEQYCFKFLIKTRLYKGRDWLRFNR